MSKEGKFSVDLNSNLNNLRFPKAIELHFYRIIGELINNTIKHSGAKHASIRLSFSDGVLLLKYTDDGKGYKLDDALKKPSGTGLSNIFHRVKLLNGDIEFINKKSRTEVRVWKRIE